MEDYKRDPTCDMDWPSKASVEFISTVVKGHDYIRKRDDIYVVRDHADSTVHVYMMIIDKQGSPVTLRGVSIQSTGGWSFRGINGYISTDIEGVSVSLSTMGEMNLLLDVLCDDSLWCTGYVPFSPLHGRSLSADEVSFFRDTVRLHPKGLPNRMRSIRTACGIRGYSEDEVDVIVSWLERRDVLQDEDVWDEKVIGRGVYCHGCTGLGAGFKEDGDPVLTNRCENCSHVRIRVRKRKSRRERGANPKTSKYCNWRYLSDDQKKERRKLLRSELSRIRKIKGFSLDDASGDSYHIQNIF